jgi:hypothetical protein
VDGEWTDDEITDPLTKMITLLNEKRDRTLIQKWGLWLTKRDPERGLKVVILLIVLLSNIYVFDAPRKNFSASHVARLKQTEGKN